MSIGGWMTLAGSGRGRKDGVPKFSGTRAQRARNRLSHAWEQVSDPASAADGALIGRCRQCRVLVSNELANYPCPAFLRQD